MLIKAFQGYRRKQTNGVWLEDPLDPQHPHEDLMDALRGGLVSVYPRGRKPPGQLNSMQPGRFL